jgi:hypothetical protein
MRAYITLYPLASGFLGCSTELGLRRGIPSHEKFSPEDEGPSDEVGGVDAYKVAVLVSVAAAILSLCL